MYQKALNLQSGQQEIADDYSCLKYGQMWKLMMKKNWGIREKLLKIFKHIFPNFRSVTKCQQRTSGTSESSFETSSSASPQNLRNWYSDNKSSWFQTFAVFWLLYAFFWVIPRRLNFICRRFGTLGIFHLHRQSVSKRRHIKFRHRKITQKEA